MDERNGTGPTRRRVLKTIGASAVVGSAAVGSTTAKPGKGKEKNCDISSSTVDATNVADAKRPTIRVDNRTDCALKVRLSSNGGSYDGKVVTVGPNHSSFDPPTGKYVRLPESDCGSSITGLEAKRPQDDEWTNIPFGTATVGGEGCS